MPSAHGGLGFGRGRAALPDSFHAPSGGGLPCAGPYGPDLLHAAQQSFVDGWQQAMWAGVAVMGDLSVSIAFRGPGRTATPADADRTEAAEALTAP
ncbi:hypothetical protein [Streptomyces sp. SAI-129]|uniref:hypothetical protein n=1 Tax=Streptomyces sp. SAI-129 TaxID=3377727 RepID=UPI003C7C4F1E